MKPNTVGRVDGQQTGQTREGIEKSQQTGLPADSIIMTLKGEMQVCDIQPGDRVITRDCGTAQVARIVSRTIAARRVQIKAGSLGHTRPDHDVILPADQPILIRDWRARALFGCNQALVPAHRLVDGEFVTLKTSAVMTVYDIEFDQPHILYVDGLEIAGQVAQHTIAKAA